MSPNPISGREFLDFHRQFLGAAYSYGVFVPKDAKNYRGPFDCAEFPAYGCYQLTGRLFGTSNHTDPASADAWSGFWLSDGRNPALGRIIPVQKAAGTPGAIILRAGAGISGHVVISDGQGGTLEAMCKIRGVCCSTLAGRRWTHGVLINWIRYESFAAPPLAPVEVLRLAQPFMRGPEVSLLQEALGIEADGIYGPATRAAVLDFQRQLGLVVDGEAGPQTFMALGIL
jgi:N-acetylmuramoyl-L-alanine amidase